MPDILYPNGTKYFFLVYICFVHVPLVVVSLPVSYPVESRLCEPMTPVRGYVMEVRSVPLAVVLEGYILCEVLIVKRCISARCTVEESCPLPSPLGVCIVW